MKKIIIDTDLCSGHGRCYVVAPEIFYDDSAGYGQVKEGVRLSTSNQKQVERAIKACPEGAIKIVDG